MRGRLDNWHHWSPLLALVLLAVMGGAAMMRPGPADAEPYHQRVRDAAEQMPYRIDDWTGTPVEAPRQAVELLKPNVLVSRSYKHEKTGERVEFLLVHCKDARDMAGHYPPICYPAHGWEAEGAEPADWRVNGVHITGMQYRFSYHRPLHGTTRIVIDNFMIMPDGEFLRQIDGVYNAAADYTLHFYGAAQIQLVTTDRMSDERRRELFHKFIGANLDVINALRSGIDRQAASGI